jgi:hypothetical protein
MVDDLNERGMLELRQIVERQTEILYLLEERLTRIDRGQSGA